MKSNNYFIETKRFFGLCWAVARASFIARNEGSYLGILWYLLNPLLTFLLLLLIFSDRLGNNIQFYPSYLLLGVIMFNLFQSSTVDSANAIMQEHYHLIKSVRFPRQALAASVVLRNIFSHIFELAFVFAALAVSAGRAYGILFYLPVFIFFVIFIYGISLFISSITPYFVDMGNIWNFGVRILWFATPIFYAIEGQTRLFYLNLANPMYYFITAARDSVIYGRMPDLWILAGAAGFSGLSLLLGLWAFKKFKGKMAELI